MSQKGLPVSNESVVYINLDENRNQSTKCRVICGGLLVGLALGVCLGIFSFIVVTSSSVWETAYIEKCATPPLSTKLIDFVSNETIEANLKFLTRKPHVAGTDAEKENAQYMRDQWISQGLDNVKVLTYDVLLSYPNASVPNKISILENGKEIFHTALHEKVLRPEDNSSDIIPPFNAYSAKGESQGDIVYANYARVEDFEYLKKNHSGIKLNGTIIMARYGQIFRGDKVGNAQDVGAKGLILFSDPADVAKQGADVNSYPDGYWLPGTGTQRGEVFKSVASGDPLTPGYPSKPYMYRKPEKDVPLPKIPVHPIDYDDARRLFSEMAGPVVRSWVGGLNVTYRIGPGFANKNRNVKMSIHTGLEERTIHDVIGIIPGSTEPDRYIILGNHRDAWVYGAIDPSSGTAVLLEVTRAFGEYMKTGWRPRRTIIFASWEAEEFGLIGSTEYVEEFQKVLGDRAVAYLNVDQGVSGNYTFYAAASPLLYKVIYDTTKRVPDPEKINRTLYESWLYRTLPNAAAPPILNLGSGSDFETFMYRIGVPSADMMYFWNFKLNLDNYPTYHTLYDTFYYMKNFIDPNFVRHKCVAQVWTEMARQLSDSTVLPMDCLDYASKLNTSMDEIKKAFATQMKQHSITFDHINSALKNFTSAARNFQERIEKIDVNNDLAVRMINDQIMQLERAFIDQLGLPGKPLLRHVVFGPISAINSFGADAFPGIVDAMAGIDDAPDPDSRWNVVREQVAVTAYNIQSAASTLVDVVSL